MIPKRITASFQLCKNILFTHKQWKAFKVGPIDDKGNPLPWLTFPAISYLLSLDLSEKDIFEFGCGVSTRFWSRVCRSVNSVEGNEAWYKKVSSGLSGNAKIHLVNGQDEKQYVEPIIAGQKKYDIIVIDGWHRRYCAEICLPYLKEDGFIIHDNTEWYIETRRVLLAYDLIPVDFFGFIPASTHTGVTSFYFNRGVKLKLTDMPVWLPGSKADNHEGLF